MSNPQADKAMKAYTRSNFVPGHGARIFIPYEHITSSVRKFLDVKSIAYSADKDTGLCESWEFVIKSALGNTFEEVLNYLIGYGFNIEECNDINKSKIWK